MASCYPFNGYRSRPMAGGKLKREAGQIIHRSSGRRYSFAERANRATYRAKPVRQFQPPGCYEPIPDNL